jgi:hypothetical protein
LFNNALVFSSDLYSSVTPDRRIVRIQSGAGLSKSVVYVLKRHVRSDVNGYAGLADLVAQFQLLVISLGKPTLNGLSGGASRRDFKIINERIDSFPNTGRSLL